MRKALPIGVENSEDMAYNMPQTAVSTDSERHKGIVENRLQSAFWKRAWLGERPHNEACRERRYV